MPTSPAPPAGAAPPVALVGEPDSPALRLAVDRALADKVAQITATLGRAPDRVHPSPRVTGYRARIDLRPGPDGVLGQSLPGTHAPVPLASIPLARPELNHSLGALPPMPGLGQVSLRSDGETVVLSAWSPRKGRGARTRRNRGADRSLKAALRALDLDALGLAGVALDGRPVQGDATTRLTVAGITHHLSPATFYQVNLEINALLVEAVGRLTDELEPAALLDLYAGAGNLSLPLAARGLPLVLIEQGRSSTADARRTVKRLGLQVDVRDGDAGAFEAGDAFFDVVLLDPPRAGAPGLLPSLLITRPKAILYVSCNPSALARDLRPARQAGYTLDRVELFDMFPQTPHVEVIARLVRPA
jgi:23S rRNA (uracil1939-C5)-methyltransferase